MTVSWGSNEGQADEDPYSPTLAQLQQEPEFDPEHLFGQQPADPLSPRMAIEDPYGVDESPYAAPTSPAGSTGSSPAAAPADNPLATRAKAKAFAKLAGAAFGALTALINLRLRLDEDDPTWLADEDDLTAITPPAGRLIARNAPLPGGEDASNLTDGIDIAIGVAGYLIKNVTAHAAVRRERRRAAQPGQPAVYQEA